MLFHVKLVFSRVDLFLSKARVAPQKAGRRGMKPRLRVVKIHYDVAVSRLLQVLLDPRQYLQHFLEKLLLSTFRRFVVERRRL